MISPDHHRSHLQVAHANMEARIEQSVAYFEVQEQLKQASLDSTTQQTLTEEIRLLTCQIMSRSAISSLQYKPRSMSSALDPCCETILCTWVETLARSSFDYILNNVQLHKTNRVQMISTSDWHIDL